ncbi:MAG: 3-alpha,7-alpha,12-alpha-trihydroxy-5-beta-chole st-24-enoyl-CoAhydratase [Myxococcaceae bacterium]|nr:3-alpha,7-alpha,12-alpha-trihydroxy-5-beta-chole st-24-enoyl-CoAhydratase [Myxococcaceae bacterium]
MSPNFASIGSTVGPREHAYGWTDLALYAAAVGAGPTQLAFLRDPSPKVLPTWGVIPAFDAVFEAVRLAGFSIEKLLHTAQLTEQLSCPPSQGVVSTTATILGIWDMRVGALTQIESRSSVDGVLCSRTVWSLLVAGVGPFESERAPGSLRTKPPKDAEPTFEETWHTQPNQALLYRLTGDINPIHAYPEAAHAAGLEQPILHGLCTYGSASRSALHALCADDPERFLSFEARFTKPVLPGQTLLTRGYLLEPGKAALTVQVVETGELAIANALFQFQE